MGVQILGRDAGNLYAACESVFVGIALEITDEGTVAELRAALELQAERCAPFPVLFVVTEPAAVPAPPVRKLIATLLRDASRYVGAWALVQEGTGFRAAVVRSVVSGLLLISRQSYPFKSFATIADAADWLGGISPIPTPARELEAAVAELKAQWGSGQRDAGD